MSEALHAECLQTSLLRSQTSSALLPTTSIDLHFQGQSLIFSSAVTFKFAELQLSGSVRRPFVR